MRRPIVIFFSLIFLGTFSFAQTDQGSILLGGEVSLNTSSTETEVETDITGQGTQTNTSEYPQRSTFTIMPSAGYFVSDGLAVGLGVGYTSTSVDQSDTVTNKSNLFEIAPFGRYYISLGNNISFFGQGQFTFASGSEETEFDSETVEGPDITEIGFDISPGIAVFAGDNISLNFFLPGIISYENRQEEETNDILGGNGTTTTTRTNSSFDINLTLQNLGFGVNYHF